MSHLKGNHILTQKLADFIVDPRVTIDACSRNIQLVPSIARGLACRVGQQLSDISFWVDATCSEEFLADVSLGHEIALVFCLPSSHQTIQVKGHSATCNAIAIEDVTFIESKTQLLTAELTALGFSPDYCKKMLDYGQNTIVEVCFQPTAIFEQSPGANAGNMLEVSQW